MNYQQNAIQVKVLSKQMESSYDDDSVADVGIILRCAATSITKVYPGKTIEIPTGISVHFGKSDFVGRIEPEYKTSDVGHFIKCTTIGAHQEEEIMISLRNDSASVIHVRQHDCLGQLVFSRVEKNFVFTNDF